MFKPRHILHPTDFSAHSKAAFEVACSIARDSGAGLLVVHVIPPSISDDDLAECRREAYRARLQGELRAVKSVDPNLPVAYLLLDGDPARVIVETATAQGMDLIVLGTHGRTGLGRLLTGSVAEYVLRRAACPVLTVKAPAVPAAPGSTVERVVAARG
jgi:nucleotide-binding universal stress UspA family protein